MTIQKMKAIFLMISFVLATALSLSAQNLKPKELPKARGYYAELLKFNPKPSEERILWDKEKFPFDAAQAEKRLSRKPYFLENISLNDVKIPEPPANSSEQTRAELNYLLQLQQNRAKIDVDASLEMAGVFYSVGIKPNDENYAYYQKNLFFIGRSLGPWFHPDSLPKTASLIAHVWQDASYFIWTYKYKYLRIRPYKLDTRIQNLEETDWAAYPSGHATNSYVNAFVYQELAPEFTDVFVKDAYDMAHSREILGVHYPSDSEAGRILARQLVNLLFSNEKFLKEFEDARQEWAVKSKGYFGPVHVPASSAIPAASSSCGASSSAEQTQAKPACKVN